MAPVDPVVRANLADWLASRRIAWSLRARTRPHGRAARSARKAGARLPLTSPAPFGVAGRNQPNPKPAPVGAVVSADEAQRQTDASFAAKAGVPLWTPVQDGDNK